MNQSERIKQFARSNCANQTTSEEVLWKKLRNRAFLGTKWRRQHPIESFILDFYCAEHKIGIELDGSSHDGKQNHDRRREIRITATGITIIRFENYLVENDSDWVLVEIWKAMGSPESPRPAMRGEGV